MGHACPSTARARGVRERRGRELPVPRLHLTPRPHRHHRDRRGRTAIRHDVPRAVGEGAGGSGHRRRPDGRLSLWEVFTQASAGVREDDDRRGQLATERALLDDTGDGTGQEAGAPGPDGALARTTYLDADPLQRPHPEVAGLLTRQRALEAEAEQLKLRKPTTPAAAWEAEFERLMIELARVSRAIPSRL